MNEQQARSYAQDANVRAFLRAIRAGESHPDIDEAYTALFGWKPGNGQVFNDFTAHPNVRTYETHDGQFIKNGKIDFTTAAGAYQIVKTTWDGLQRKYPWLRTFSPDSQDLAAICLIHDRGAIGDVLDGRIVQAIGKLGDEWASLPSATVGQPTVALGKVLGVYTRYGGHLAGDAATPVPPAPEKRQDAPMPAPPRPDAEPYAAPAPQPEKPKMAIPAIVAALLPTLIESIPKLGKLFGSGSAVAERNIAAATAAMKIAQEAVGAVNAQETVERIKTDPAAAAAATQAIESRWFELAEGGGGGIDGARKAALEYSQPDGPRFWFNPAFWISVVLLAMPLMLLVDVFYVNPSAYAGELRTQVVTGVLMVIGMVGGYWIGTSFSSAKKDERWQ